MFIDLDDADYLYNQIYNSIKKKINTGELKTNQKLPSIRKLSAQLNISINTVSNAYYQLEKEGYIRSFERSGFFVEKSGDILIQKKDQIPCEQFIVSDDDTNYKYDFSFSGVDKSCFNYKAIRKAFKDSINEDNTIILGKSNGLGLFELRKSIADYLRYFREINVDPNQIVVSSGSNELLILIKNLLSNPFFGFENPGYAYYGLGFHNNFNSIPIPVNSSGIDIDFLKNTKVNVVSVTPSHQFPTSVIMPINKKIELLNWAYQYDDRYIIEDDYDAEFKYKLRPISPLKTLDKNDKVIYIGNFSRTVTPAMRISFMVLPKTLMKKFFNVLKKERCPVSVFTQSALSKFIDSGDLEKQINQMRKVYSKKYELILSKLQSCNLIEPISTDCGTSMVLNIKTNKSQENLLKKLKENSINLIPLSNFFKDKNSSKNYYLLGFAKMSFENIESGINTIIEIINK